MCLLHFDNLRFYHLEKQSLLSKIGNQDFETILKSQIGLHSTDYLTPYFSLYARVENFDPVNLFQAISKEQSAIRMRAFRRTVFVVHRENLETIIGSMILFLEKFKQDNLKYMVKMGMKEGSYEKIRSDIIKVLKGKPPMTTNQIKKKLSSNWTGEWIKSSLHLLEFEGMIARIGQRYITDKTINYGLFDDHFPELQRESIDPEKSLRSLFKTYLHQFGPITINDFSWWLPLNKTETKNLIDSMKDEIIRFDFNSNEYLMFKEDYEVLNSLEPKFESLIVNLLPYEDHYPKAYKIRNWHLAEEIESNLYKVGPMDWGQLRPSIWVNGEIKGRWEIDFVDDKKTEMKTEIVYLEKEIEKSKDKMLQIREHLESLEAFANEKLLPIMNRN